MLQCTDKKKKQPAANIIDGNVQLHVLSLIPDNFQGVTEIKLLNSLGAAKYY